MTSQNSSSTVVGEIFCINCQTMYKVNEIQEHFSKICKQIQEQRRRQFEAAVEAAGVAAAAAAARQAVRDVYRDERENKANRNRHLHRMMRFSKDDQEGDRHTQIIPIESSSQTLPPFYAPSLVFPHGKKFSKQTFCTLSDGHCHARSIPDMRGMRCVGSCYGWLIMQSYGKPSQCYLFNPISLAKIHLPPLRNSNNNLVGVLTSSPIDTNCVVLLASTVRNSFVFCKLGDDQWIEKDFGPKKTSFSARYLFTIPLVCKDKIYIFGEEGMVVIDVHYPTFTIKFHERDWSEDLSRPEMTLALYKKFFVESCGEIFHVMVNYFQASSARIIETLDILKLEVSTMEWVQVDSLGDRIFLLGAASSASLSSTETGMLGNCIYFYTENYTTLHRFDMDHGTITTTLPCPKLINWDRPFWVLPNCKLQVKNEAAKLEEVIYDQRGGKHLPIELLEIILSGPFLGDCIRFRLIYKSRMTVTPLLRPHSSLIQTECGSQQLLVWLLSMPKNKKGLCNLYNPIYNDAYTMNIPHELAGAVVRCSKYGWLLMSKGKTSTMFFNPLSKETIQLPEFGREYKFLNISFSSTPTSPDCVVFGHIDYIIMQVCRKEENTWTWEAIWVDTTWIFAPAHCSPVFYNGVFYSMGIQGNLGIYNPSERRDSKKRWAVVQNGFTREVTSATSSSFRSFIMEYDGEILSVTIGHLGKSVRVYKLNGSNMKWIKLESLGDKVIFLSHTGSLVVDVGLKGVENRIYLPRFQGKDIVYYSLSTGKYHCFGGKFSAKDWINTSEQLDCTWIQMKEYEELTVGGSEDGRSNRQEQHACNLSS